MRSFSFTRRAQSALAGIHRYSRRALGLEQADLYTQKITSYCSMLAENTGVGRLCPTVGSKLRRTDTDAT